MTPGFVKRCGNVIPGFVVDVSKCGVKGTGRVWSGEGTDYGMVFTGFGAPGRLFSFFMSDCDVLSACLLRVRNAAHGVRAAFISLCCWQIVFNKEREGRQLMVMSAASLDLSVEASSGGSGKGRCSQTSDRSHIPT